MLKPLLMISCLVMTQAVFTVEANPLQSDPQMIKRIKDLEDKVRDLQRENQLMEQEIRLLKELVYEKLNIQKDTNNNSDNKGLSDCDQRLSEQKVKIDDLKARGVKKAHPYYLQAQKTYEAIQKECKAAKK